MNVKKILCTMNNQILMILIACLFSALFEVTANAATVTSGDYTYTENTDGTINIEKYDGEGDEDGVLMVPNTIDGKKVVKIGDWCFYECIGLKKIIIPQGVTSLGAHCFSELRLMIELTIPGSVTSVGNFCFSGCTGLTELTIPESVTTIGGNCFVNCTGLKKLILPKTLNGSYVDCLDCTNLTEITIPKGVSWVRFERCANLSEITIPEGVTSLCDSCFNGCSSLAKVSIPKTVNSIGNRCFWNCANLSEISLSDGLTSIGENAFNGCTSLTEISIPTSVTNIGENAFNGCTSLTEISIPTSVTNIGAGAFSGCTGLIELIIPESVTSIGGDISTNCSNLEKLVLPKDLTTYGNGSFSVSGCKKLKELVIPKGVTSLGARCFNGCTDLAEITIPTSITSIGEFCFNGCKGLTQLTIPDSVTTFGKNCFNSCSGLKKLVLPQKVTDSSLGLGGCSSLTEINIPEGVTSVYFYGCSKISEVTIPEGVTSLDNRCFYGCSSLTKVSIPKTVASISDDCFRDCSKLSEIIISDGLTSIGENAFNGCTSLTEISIPTSVTNIGENAFNGCTSLTEISIPTSVTNIGAGAFSGCTGLTELIIPESVTSIGGDISTNCSNLEKFVLPKNLTTYGNGSFGVSGCKKLKELVIPKGVTSLGARCFNECTELVEITIPISITSIDGTAFRDCTGLTKINIPEGITYLGNSWFNRCSSLKKVIIPESVTSIGESCFSWCADLTEITIPKGVTSLGKGAFEGCSSLTKISIPTGVTSIGDRAFSGCSSLTEIIIPKGVTSIGDGVFASCSGLTAITIPEGVTSIGGHAFNNCSKLTAIIIPDTVTSIGTYAFYDCFALKEIFFPDSVTEFGDYIFERSNKKVYASSDSKAFDHFANLGFTIYGSCWSYENSKKTLYVGENENIDDQLLDFDNYDAVENIIIKKDVKVVGNNTFVGFDKVKNVTVESDSSLSEIGESAFEGCTSLTEINIPDTVDRIASSAFKGCTVSEIKATVRRTSFAHQWCAEHGFNVALINCYVEGYWACEAIGNKEAKVYEYSGNDSDVVIPSKISKLNITLLDDDLLKNNETITSIELPASIKELSEKNFEGLDLGKIEFVVVRNSYAHNWVKNNNLNYKLKNVYTDGVWTYETVDRKNATLISYEGDDTVVSVPKTTTLGYNTIIVTQIDGELFNNNKVIKEVILPDSITTIHAGAFANSSLEKITIPGNNTVIEKNTSDNSDPFTGIDNLKVVSVKNAQAYSYAKAKGYNIFFLSNDWIYDKSTGTLTLTGAINDRDEYPPEWIDLNAKKIVINKDVEKIGKSAFAGMNTVKTISFEEGAHLTEIGENAFADCSGLSVIGLPETLQTIGSAAFKNCQSLKKIEIPNSVSNIASNAFEGCANIKLVLYSNSYALSYAKNKEIAYEANEFVLNQENTDISIGSVAYTGSPLTPTPTVKYGNTTLIKDIDYIVQYSNNISPGDGIAKIIGIGDYSGCLSKTFKIDSDELEYYEFTYEKGITYKTLDWRSYFAMKEYKDMWIEKLAVTTPSGEVINNIKNQNNGRFGNPVFTSTYGSGLYTIDYVLYTVDIQVSTSYTRDNQGNYMPVTTEKRCKGSYWGSGTYYITVKERKTVTIPELKSATPDLPKEISKTKYSLGFTVAPSGARYTSVDWSSSDKSTATVDDGIVTVLKPGKFVISAVIDGSVKVKWDFDIEPEGDISTDGSIEYDPDDGYQLNNTSISGLKENRDYTVEKENVSDNVIKITAKGTGFYTGEIITYFTKDGDEFDNKGNDWSYDDSTLVVDGTTENAELSNDVLVEAVNNNSSKNVKSIEIGLSIKKITDSTFDNIDGIKEVVFDGDAPSISDNAFEGMTVTITYSQRAKGWDSIVSSNKQFGGNVTYKMIPCEHVWDGGVETTPATFTATGIKTFTCKECGTTKTETIPVKVCSHRWDSGVVTVVATETIMGNRRYTCLDCGVTRDEVIPMLAPSPKAEDQTTIVPSPNPQPSVVPTPSVTPTTPDTPQTPADETVNTFTTKQGTFKITGAKTVTFTKPASKVASVVIPATVSYKGYSYKITAIGDGAFKNNKKLRIIAIGKNVDTIGKDAFNGCKNLKTIIINSSKIKSVGKTAFKNTSNKPTVKCPKKKIKLYKKLLQTAKLSKKAKVKKL